VAEERSEHLEEAALAPAAAGRRPVEEPLGRLDKAGAERSRRHLLERAQAEAAHPRRQASPPRGDGVAEHAHTPQRHE